MGLLADRQGALFSELAAGQGGRPLTNAVESGRKFVAGDPDGVCFGGLLLKDYLKQAGQRHPLVVSEILSGLDWRVFERRYGGTGRAPYAPMRMMGLILYGLMRGISSLRALEEMARVDLGAIYVSGGITPDHANIGRFIVLHEASLRQDFFEELTRAVLKVTGSSGRCQAGDGTVIEAACSHYKTLRQEALQEHLEEARARQLAHPEEAALARKVERLQRAQEAQVARQRASDAHGRKSEVQVSGVEPEAMVQRLKRGRGFGPSYKPSVLVDEAQVITGHAVDASSETAVMEAMLDQAKRVTGADPETLLLDGGYCENALLEMAVAREIGVLCPCREARSAHEAGIHQGEVKRLFPKSAFTYDEARDLWHCPGEKTLVRLRKLNATDHTPAGVLYGGTGCADCPLRARCTTSAHGRQLKRYAGESCREALRQVMTHEAAKKKLARRKTMVEPVFSRLRERQGLQRFRRRGLAGVRREFALHVLAYNLMRAVALGFVGFLWWLLHNLLAFQPKPIA